MAAIAAAVVAHLLYLLADGAPDPMEPPDGESVATTRPVVQTSDSAPAPLDVQPGVHPAGEAAEPALNAVYGAVAADLGVRAAADAGEQPGAADEHPDDALSPRERAWAAATKHADRHGALPTVSELQALADVSRGTAGAVLKSLRQRPQSLHLVPDTLDPETQP